MTDEVQALAEVDSAQAPEVTATTDNAQNAPVVAENQDGGTQEEKKYSQAEIDAMIGKRLAREQRKWEREQQAKQAPVPAMPTDIPTADQFDSPQAYGDFIRAEAEKLV